MDPYLESYEWTSVHHSFSSQIARQLAPKVRPKYIVRSVERFVVEVPHLTIEIKHVIDGQLVTAIEVISPTNKRGIGYQQYLSKRELILASETHLLEIDLLRMGRRVPMREPLPDAPYFVFLSREEKRPYLDVWPIQLDEPLPVVPVPLLPDDPDVLLDLQLALTTLYDEMGYDLSVDYSQPPEIPLEGEAANLKQLRAVWATELLQKAGFPSG
jgi:hypothetical protein